MKPARKAKAKVKIPLLIKLLLGAYGFAMTAPVAAYFGLDRIAMGLVWTGIFCAAAFVVVLAFSFPSLFMRTCGILHYVLWCMKVGFKGLLGRGPLPRNHAESKAWYHAGAGSEAARAGRRAARKHIAWRMFVAFSKGLLVMLVLLLLVLFLHATK